MINCRDEHLVECGKHCITFSWSWVYTLGFDVEAH